MVFKLMIIGETLLRNEIMRNGMMAPIPRYHGGGGGTNRDLSPDSAGEYDTLSSTSSSGNVLKSRSNDSGHTDGSLERQLHLQQYHYNQRQSSQSYHLPPHNNSNGMQKPTSPPQAMWRRGGGATFQQGWRQQGSSGGNSQAQRSLSFMHRPYLDSDCDSGIGNQGRGHSISASSSESDHLSPSQRNGSQPMTNFHRDFHPRSAFQESAPRPNPIRSTHSKLKNGYHNAFLSKSTSAMCPADVPGQQVRILKSKSSSNFAAATAGKERKYPLIPPPPKDYMLPPPLAKRFNNNNKEVAHLPLPLPDPPRYGCNLSLECRPPPPLARWSLPGETSSPSVVESKLLSGAPPEDWKRWSTPSMGRPGVSSLYANVYENLVAPFGSRKKAPLPPPYPHPPPPLPLPPGPPLSQQDHLMRVRAQPVAVVTAEKRLNNNNNISNNRTGPPNNFGSSPPLPLRTYNNNNKYAEDIRTCGGVVGGASSISGNNISNNIQDQDCVHISTSLSSLLTVEDMLSVHARPVAVVPASEADTLSVWSDVTLTNDNQTQSNVYSNSNNNNNYCSSSGGCGVGKMKVPSSSSSSTTIATKAAVSDGGVYSEKSNSRVSRSALPNKAASSSWVKVPSSNYNNNNNSNNNNYENMDDGDDEPMVKKRESKSPYLHTNGKITTTSNNDNNNVEDKSEAEYAQVNKPRRHCGNKGQNQKVKIANGHASSEEQEPPLPPRNYRSGTPVRRSQSMSRKSLASRVQGLTKTAKMALRKAFSLDALSNGPKKDSNPPPAVTATPPNELNGGALCLQEQDCTFC